MVRKKAVLRARDAAKRRETQQDRSTAHRRKPIQNTEDKRRAGAETIHVDAKLEKTGEATVPSAASAPNAPLKAGMDCAKCAKRKPLVHFNQLSKRGRDGPAVRDSVCKACRAEEHAENLRAQNLERAATRFAQDARARKAKLEERPQVGRPTTKRARTAAPVGQQVRAKPGSAREVAREMAREKVKEFGKTAKLGGKKAAETRDQEALQHHAMRELARRELARRRLLAFTVRFEGQKVDEETGDLVEVERAKGKGYMAGWVHKDVCARLERFLLRVRAGEQPRLMLFEPPRHGKLCANSTPVLTPNGWTTHGELRPGDEVYSVEGAPTRVVARSETAAADYVVTLWDGEEIRCHANHEWPIYDRPANKWRVAETKELVERNSPVRLRPAVNPVEREVIARLIVSVRREPNGEVGRCIQVDSEDGLYLVGRSLVPTHNSTLASRMFPAWALGQDPTLEIIAASYGSSLPEQFSRNVRAILRDPEYQSIFPKTRLDPERENVQGWATTNDGLYIPAGVGSGISGKGADLLIIDDPFKGAEDAESPTQREKVLDWYYSEAYTRLSPNAGILIICTRWHDADLAGSLLAAQEEQEKESRDILESELEDIQGDDTISDNDRIQARKRAYAVHHERLKDTENWEVVSYPAIAELDEYRMPDGRIVHKRQDGATLLRHAGEALHPDRFPIERLRRIRKSFYARGRQRFWHALYQQKPVPDEGVHFSRDMVRIKPLPPLVSRTHWLGLTAWDLAAGQRAVHDWTVGVHGKMDEEGAIHITELVRGRFDGMHGVASEVLNEYERNKPHMIGVERGQLELVLMPSIVRELEERNRAREQRERLTPVFARGDYALTPIQDPVLRAQPLQGLMQQGKVVFAHDLLWLEEAIGELIRFPGGVHDDIVMALAWLIRLAVKFSAPRAPVIHKRGRSWRDQLAGYVRGSGFGHMGA